MTALTTIACFILLILPTTWEKENDEKGDFNKGWDVVIRIAIGLFISLVAWYCDGRNFLAAFNLSMAIHFIFFDYWIAYTLIKNGTIELPRNSRHTWFTYVAKDGFVDNVKHWKCANPWLKLGVRVLYFVGSVMLYFTK